MDYQNQEIDTSQPAVPDTVSVALAELAGEMSGQSWVRVLSFRPTPEPRRAGTIGLPLAISCAGLEPVGTARRRQDARQAG